MLVRPRQLRIGSNPTTVSLSAEELSTILGELDTLYEPASEGIHTTLDLQRTGDTTLVVGRFTLPVRFSCARCAESCDALHEIALRWTLLPKSVLDDDRLDEEEERELSADDLDVSFYEGDEVDLAELVREAILLELPSCPHCGLDACPGLGYLAAPTAEASGDPDPRWAALAALRKAPGEGAS